jgi:DNA-binding transcriptional ArsR family regulator
MGAGMSAIGDGDALLLVLSALANPHRLRILAVLHRGSTHVSQLARDVGISRPLVHLHLARLEAAGLVTGHHEVSDDGKAMRMVEVTDFALRLDPGTIAALAATISDPPAGGTSKGENR